MIVVFPQQGTYPGFKEWLNHECRHFCHLSSQKYTFDVVGKQLFGWGAWWVYKTDEKTKTNQKKCTANHRPQTKTKTKTEKLKKLERHHGNFLSLGRTRRWKVRKSKRKCYVKKGFNSMNHTKADLQVTQLTLGVGRIPWEGRVLRGFS